MIRADLFLPPAALTASGSGVESSRLYVRPNGQVVLRLRDIDGNQLRVIMDQPTAWQLLHTVRRDLVGPPRDRVGPPHP